MDQTRNEDDTKNNHVTLTIDPNENAIHFEFNFHQETDDIEIAFKVFMRARLEFNLTNLAHFRIAESAHQYHENGLLYGDPDISYREHVGYNRDAIMHLHRDNSELRDMNDADLMMDMPEDIGDQIEQLRIFNQAIGSSQSKSNKTLVTTSKVTQKQVTQSHVSHQDNTLDKAAGGSSDKPGSSGFGFSGFAKRGFNMLFGGETTTETVVGKKARTNQSSKPEKVTLVIEMARMPALMVEIDKHKTIAQLKVSDIFKKHTNKLKLGARQESNGTCKIRPVPA